MQHKNGAIEKQITDTGFNVQTRNNVKRLYEKFGTENVFGRTDVAEICGLSYSAAGKLIAKLKEKSLIKMLKDLEKEGIVLNYKSGVLKDGKRIY